MDSHALEVLEFTKIRELLAACAACSLGQRRARALRPSRDPAWIHERLKETSEARQAVLRYGVPPFGGLTDVKALLRKALAGRILEGEELRRIADAVRAARRVREYFEAADMELPRLQRIAGQLHENREFEDQVEATLDDEGQVRDDASSELRSLARQHAAAYDRLQDIMHRVVARETGGSMLQEPLVVQRSGRYCVPIRVSAQGRFNGIVHDRSDSGQTVFMEPLEVVPVGNELREIELAIEQKKLRLLKDLSVAVATIAADIAADLHQLGVLDFIFAKAALAGKMEAVEPTLGGQGTFHLVRARHPLIVGDVVPIDVWIGRDFDTLVISGPNTGGKTVTLRCVGLLVLMAQSGLHIPAGVGSEIAVFDEVHADIGDEQSIEQSLSTFSSHMTQVIRIIHRLRALQRRSPGAVSALVLLDEVGAGTDPSEGSALARAILEELQALGARTLATTHYNELKTFAYTANRVQNASVEFDVKTLRPTFRLLIGEPGTSNAFEIAQRLGLPRSITRRARTLMDDQDLAVEEVIRRMEQARQRLAKEANLAAEEREELEYRQREYAALLQELHARRQQALDEGFAEAREIVERAEQQAREIIADLQRQPRQSKITEQRRREIARLRHEVEESAAQYQSAIASSLAQEEDGASTPDFAPQLGDPVHVTSLGRDGILLRSTEGDKVLVEIGKMRVEVAARDLQAPQEPISEAHRALAEKLKMSKQFTVPREVNLIGYTVEEAILALEKYLDDAFLAGLDQVRIIHGKGTGALRRGIHEFLRQNRHVRTFSIADRTEGGDGVTIVTL
ncbi:MAG: endonuclease MutS2 [Candidatus Zipacnadales bacterium]